MEYRTSAPEKSKSKTITPRLIIHGGAGNITPSNLPPARYKEYHSALLSVVSSTYNYLLAPNSALDTVTYAVAQLEDNPLFNSGKGAVFTRDGVNELEASLMVSSGQHKRGVGLMGLRHVRNPIKLAREMLIRGDHDLQGGNGEHRGPMISTTSGDFENSSHSRGAQGHSQLHGEGAEHLAREWGVDMVDEGYFFVQNRWDEHKRGLDREKAGSGFASWDAHEYVPQGTCGAVALDAEGVCAVATSTGGMTNKLTGRIGDTPTLGAGFWAEEWEEDEEEEEEETNGPVLVLSNALQAFLADCLPSLTTYTPISLTATKTAAAPLQKTTHATALSGTGNGDSFLRLAAVRTASAISRYRTSPSKTSLQEALTLVTGPGGELQKSAGERWKHTGEGEGGMIGIESVVVREDCEDEDEGDDRVEGNVDRGKREKKKKETVKKATAHVVAEFNCGGMFRAWVTDGGKVACRIWREGEERELGAQYGGLEGREYELREWLGEKRSALV